MSEPMLKVRYRVTLFADVPAEKPWFVPRSYREYEVTVEGTSLLDCERKAHEEIASETSSSLRYTLQRMFERGA